MTEGSEREAEVYVLAVWARARQIDYVWRTSTVEISDGVKVESNLQAQIVEITERLARETDSVPARVAGLGKKLAKQLLPPRIGEALTQPADASETIRASEAPRDASTPLLWIISNEGVIPWEFFRPAGSRLALGERYQLTRWVFDRPCPSSFSLDPFVLCLGGPSTKEKQFSREADAVRKIAEERGWDFSQTRPRTAAEFLGCLEDETPAALHVITHAGRDKKSPLLSHLLLAEGQQLTVADLEEIDLRPRSPFVFLNACESAAPTLGFSGSESFATQFVQQGAAALVGSYWKVDSTAASGVAAEIYRALGTGRSLGEALRLGRSKVWEASSKNSSPWAFTAYGHPGAKLDSRLEPRPAVRWPGRFLEIPRHEYVPDVSVPGSLLRADHGIVPFHLRDRELEDLHEWAVDEQELGLRLYTGPAGQGKTRLALRLCEILRDEGWRAGFLRSTADLAVEEALEEIFAGGGPVLAVVDYAETRRKLLASMAELIYRRRHEGPFRIILLSRRREEWWRQLKRQSEPVGSVFAGPATRHFALQPLATSRDERIETFHLAAESFARTLNQSRPELPELDLEERYFDPVLMIHMYALASVEGVDIKGEDGVLDTTLEREMRFWEQGLAARGLPQGLLRGVRRTMCTITLGGGTLDRAQTVEIMQSLKAFDGQPRAVLDEIACILHSVYPGEHQGRWLAPVQPDILAEHLVEKDLAEDPQEVFNIVLGEQSSTPPS